MKICLINPAQTLQKRFGKPFVFQPLGLLYVAAALEREFTVEIIDASLLGWRALREESGKYYLGIGPEEIKEKLKVLKPDIVGISCLFSINEASALEAAQAVKSVSKDIVVVWGGVHPSVRPIETLSSGCVDFVVIGEGEITAPELFKVLESGNYSALRDVRGIAYRDSSGKAVLTGPREKIQDLDALAFPARHLADMEEYFKAMGVRKGAREMYTYNQRWTSIITSRGCPYQCNFCSIHLSMGRQFRRRSPENVIEEIKLLKRDYDIRHINFEDDNLTLERNRAAGIFDLMIRENLSVSWSTPNGIRGDTLDEELIKKMKESGCRRVFIAPESGSQHVVNDIIKKNLDLKKVEKAVGLLHKYGIVVDGSFVIGSIGETKSDIWKTIRFALRLKRLGMQAAGFHIATPYYGTALYEEASQKGLLRKDLNQGLFTTTEPLISVSQWSRLEIRRLRGIADWLVNYKLRDKINYCLGKCPPLWAFLKLAKGLIIYLAGFLLNLGRGFSGWGRLILNAAKHIISDLTHTLPNPEYIVYEVTDACNSRCRHCAIWKHKPKENILTPGEVEKVLSGSFFSHIRAVLLTGGEAVLRSDIKELISAVHNACPKAAISLSTNALLAQRVLEVVRYAINSDIKLNIGISLDALGDSHDAIRGVKGNFAKVEYLLRELISLKEEYPDKIGVVVIGHTLSNLTVDTLKEVTRYARSLKIGCLTQLYEEFIYYHNIGNENARNYRRSDNSRLIAALKTLSPSFHNEVLISSLKHKLKFHCAAMRKFFLLRCDGTVTPCLHYSDAGSGNLRLDSAAEIWNSQAAAKSRRLVKDCPGCSNSWATSWSMEDWFISFIGIMARVRMKSLPPKIK